MANKGNTPGSLPKIYLKDFGSLNTQERNDHYPPEPFRIKVTEPNELLVV